MSYRIIVGDALERLTELEAASVQTCVTSPPYWGLRDYGTATWEGGDDECDHLPPPTRASVTSTLKNDGRPNPGAKAYEAATPTPYRDECGKCGAKRIDSQLGLEPTPDEYVEKLVDVFRGVWRVLRDDGTLWLNLGDSYAGSWGNQGRKAERGTQRPINGEMLTPVHDERYPSKGSNTGTPPPGLKPKDLVGIPWRVAFALQADGWYLRSDVIWSKPNPMPESVTDRPTKAHEYLFLLTKSPRYFYDADAIRETFDAPEGPSGRRAIRPGVDTNGGGQASGEQFRGYLENAGRNKRSVWTVSTQPYPGAHFATFPPKLIEPCVKAGTPPKACGLCGAPWQRQTEHGEIQSTGGSKTGARASNMDTVSSLGQSAEKGAFNTGEFIQRERITTGWTATCEHDDDSGVAVVLDPFNGAGTTGIVATRLERDYVGIELNPEYADMARRRIHDDAPLLNVEATA
jgi:DNA modification methylase